MSEEDKERLRIAQKKQWQDPNSTYNSEVYRNKLKKSEEDKKKSSITKKKQWQDPNSTYNSEVYRNKLKRVRKEQWTKERRKAQSKRLTGKGNPFYGKKHREESRKKMSSYAQNRPEEVNEKIAIARGCKRYTNPSKEFKEIFNGLMLSDGSLVLPPNKHVRNAFYSTISIHREYSEFQMRLFEKEGFSVSGKIYKRAGGGFEGYDTKPRYYFNSKLGLWLTEQYHRWYPNERKIIPPDLRITPKMLLHAFLGDGWSTKRERTRKGRKSSYFGYRIGFATHGYTHPNVVMFKEKINELGFNFTVAKDNSMVTDRKPDFYNFFELIGPCPFNCFRDKWKG